VVQLSAYDTVILAFSGGKDSTAAFLHLLELQVPHERIELWHHEVDGREGSRLMDWPCTAAYCRAFADAFQVPLYFSWREGGFEREMLRDNIPTAPIKWENPDRTIGTTGGNGPDGTRLKFPQVSANLSVRWCSAYLKIDVCSAALRNQKRFIGKRVLIVSGERAEESPCRARYKSFEEDRTSASRRTVHRWRPIHAWSEKEVWEIIRRHGVNPHPAYHLGWSRLSCRACIFGQADQWASLRLIDPDGFRRIAEYEQQFGVTIHRNQSVEQLAASGRPHSECAHAQLIEEAMNPTWDGRIRIPSEQWMLPAGAFRRSGGPT
jgi:3'-phosphoadenosine 5'-phosphosulfate sulfotransferase (PAPS reductase)/FAD synthetase